MPFTGGSIALVDGDNLVIRAATGRFEHEALGQRLARGPSRSWRVVETLEPIRLDDLQAVGSRITGAEASKAVHSWLGVPIEWRGAGIGLLEVDSTEVAAFTEEDHALIVTIGRALAGPIDLAGRYAAEQRATALRDAFTGVISHELRTPITTIYGMSQVLRQHSETMDPETRRQSIADIEEEADRLRRLAEAIAADGGVTLTVLDEGEVLPAESSEQLFGCSIARQKRPARVGRRDRAVRVSPARRSDGRPDLGTPARRPWGGVRVLAAGARRGRTGLTG